MRSIKFRVYDPDISKMLDFSEVAKYPLEEVLQECEEANVSLMQYTGLKDKNGKEIYEGDIVSYPDYPNHTAIAGARQLPAVVEFKDGKFVVGEKDLFYWVSESNGIGKTSVIGNIYKNPDLLEAK